jgi:hypothetical protein
LSLTVTLAVPAPSDTWTVVSPLRRSRRRPRSSRNRSRRR